MPATLEQFGIVWAQAHQVADASFFAVFRFVPTRWGDGLFRWTRAELLYYGNRTGWELQPDFREIEWKDWRGIAVDEVDGIRGEPAVTDWLLENYFPE